MRQHHGDYPLNIIAMETLRKTSVNKKLKVSITISEPKCRLVRPENIQFAVIQKPIKASITSNNWC